MIKSSSKYISLEKLLDIQANSYRTKCGQYEYAPDEIDSEIYQKQTNTDVNDVEQLLKSRENEERIQEMNKSDEVSSKIKTFDSQAFTSFDNSLELAIDNSELSPRNSRNKYTMRRSWIEKNKKGEFRTCYSTYDNNRGAWCAHKKSTYSYFRTMFLVNDSTDNYATDTHLRTINLSYYGLKDSLPNILNKYELSLTDTNMLKDGLALYIQAEKSYDEAMTQTQENIKETRKYLSDFKFNTLYKENEINKCSQNIKNLIKVSVQCTGVKKGKRKMDYQLDKVGFIMLDPSIDTKNALQVQEALYHMNINDIALRFSDEIYKTHERTTLVVKECDFNACRDGSIFYGFKEMLMSCLYKEAIL